MAKKRSIIVQGKTRILNLKKDKLDPRDLIRRVTRPKKAVPLPPKADVLAIQPEIRDQGDEGACTGFGAARVAKCGLTKQGVDLGGSWTSPAFIYYAERMDDGTTGEDAGSTIRESVKALANYGICREPTFPYKAGKYAVKPPKKAFKEALLFKASVYERIPQQALATGLMSAIAAGFPVIFGIDLYESFQNVGKTGMVPVPDRANEQLLGGHCMVIVGYRTVSKGKRLFQVANSWSTDWGKDGYCFIPESVLKTDASDFWVIREETQGA